MAKAPRPGAVKTRLIPPLTAEEACALHACFLRDVTELVAAVARRAGAAPFVAFFPPESGPAFDGLLPRGFHLIPQIGADLTARLKQVTTRLFAQGYKAVALLNADSPTLPHAALYQAVRVLGRPGGGIGIGPADDGGYYLIGMKQYEPRLFENIEWSTARVFEQTVARAQESGLDVAILPKWYDVDDAKSLARLCQELFPGPRRKTPAAAVHSRVFLRRWLARGGAARLAVG